MKILKEHREAFNFIVVMQLAISLVLEFSKRERVYEFEIQTLYIANQSEILNHSGIIKVSNQMFRDQMAYFLFAKHWKYSKMATPAMLFSLNDDNASLYQGSVVNASLFGLYSSAIVSLDNRSYFNLLRLNERNVVKIPKLVRDKKAMILEKSESLKIKENEFVARGEYCSFKIETDKPLATEYSHQWVEEKEKIEKFKKLHNIEKLEILKVKAKFSLTCPWYRVFSEAYTAQMEWIKYIEPILKKQMDWNPIQEEIEKQNYL